MMNDAKTATAEALCVRPARLDPRLLAQGDLAGDYDISAGGFNLGTATIEDDGSFAGDIFGCVLAGTATVADPNFNQFGIETDTSGACPAGTINGAGFVDEIGNIVLMAVETTNGTGYVLNLIKK